MKIATKPLVFISASKLDIEWRDRLKISLSRYDDQIEWWDDSRIETSSEWSVEIASAIERASVAVVLLSPEYLSSDTAMSELEQLAQRTETGRLKLFPLLLRNCEWQKVPVVSKTQVWAMARPIGTLSDSAAKHELVKITESILKIARKGPALARRPQTKRAVTNTASQPDFRFSKAAEAVIRSALQLAKKSGRTGVTSSCLLFAFAARARSQPDTCRFVRTTLDRTGKYAAELSAFLADGKGAGGQSNSEGGTLLGKVSKNIRATLEKATKIAFDVSGKSRDIHQRHLFAALLVTPSSGEPPIALQRLKEMGVELSTLRREFREYVRSQATGEDPIQWDAVLIPEGTKLKVAVTGWQEHVAEFSTGMVQFEEEEAVTDALQIEDYAIRFARIITLRATELPLSIGLFGEWGSGKTYFMKLLRQAIKNPSTRVGRTPTAQTGPKDWCDEVASVRFNAWHYLDTNLWASLVTEVFDQLFDHLAGDEGSAEQRMKQATKILKELEKAKGAVAGAEDEREEMKKQAGEAKVELQKMERAARHVVERRKRCESFIAGALDSIGKLLPEGDRKKGWKDALQTFGLDKITNSLRELEARVTDFSSLGGRLRAIGMEVFSQLRRKERLWYLAGALIGVPLLAGLIGAFPALWKESLGQAGMLFGQILGLMAGAAAWLGQQARWAGEQITQVEEFIRKAGAMREVRRNDDDVIAAKKRVKRYHELESQATEAARTARAKVRKLEEELQELRPERRLFRFIEERAAAKDYRQHLGLVSLVRRDFRELSRLFTEKTNGATDWERLAGPAGKCIDRIVLYVDDLDRCQPQRVVEVLEAVHLLLDFRLFVAVVAVDPRWVKQSLRAHYARLLGGLEEVPTGADPRLIAEGPARNGARRMRIAETQATPLDYLEKIFHIPFHLPSMSRNGFEELIVTLAGSHGSEGEATGTPTAPMDKGGANEPREAMEQAHATELSGTKKAKGEGAQSDTHGAAEPKSDDHDTKQARPLGIVQLEDWDVTHMNRCAALIQTPRGVKRFVNTYRLVRAGLDRTLWDDFRANDGGGSQCGITLLLLAVAAGYPSIARAWFAALRRAGGATWLVATDDEVRDMEGWRDFEDALLEVAQARSLPAKKQMDKLLDSLPALPKLKPEEQPRLFVWLDQVERFAF
jgi:hypothetical protein